MVGDERQIHRIARRIHDGRERKGEIGKSSTRRALNLVIVFTFNEIRCCSYKY